MERSEYIEFFKCSKFLESNSNCVNDENDNTTPNPLFDDQYQATIGDSLISTYEEPESFHSFEETLDEFETTSPQNHVKMPNYPKTVSPQNDITVQASNSKSGIVVSSLPASVEFFPTDNCSDDINAHTNPDQLNNDQNQSVIEDCLFHINKNLENFEFMEEIWYEFGATKPPNQVSTANSWDNFVTAQLQNEENANATPDQQTEYQNQVAGIGDILLDLSEELENLQPTEEECNNPGVTNLQNQLTEARNWDKFVAAQLDSLMPTEEYFNVAGTLTSQNETTLQAGCSGPETVVVSLPATELFSPAKPFVNGSQPPVTLHQKVESTTEETYTCPPELQSLTQSYVPTVEFCYDAGTFTFQTQVNMPSHSTGCHKKFRNNINCQRHIKEMCQKTNGAGTSRTKEDHLSYPKVSAYIPVTCKNCDPPKQLNKWGLLKHKVTHHLEILLLSSKPESLSEEEYKQNCEYVMDKELLSCERKYANEKNPEFVCSFCSNSLKGKQGMRYHLYSKHKNLLIEKLSK